MKRFLLSISFLLVLVIGKAQTTVFTDNFNTSTGVTYTTASAAIGTSTTWSFRTLGTPDFGARIDGGLLDLTNDAGATVNQVGYGFGYTLTSSFSSPYNTTLSSNTGMLTWTFNMRQIRTDPAGFASGSYGVGFILASSSASAITIGNGYAVVLGQAGTTDPIRLAKFTNGLQGTLTDIITSNTVGLTDFGADYLSIKVTYTPSTNTWELFVRNDGTTTFADPTVGTLTSQGTVVDATYTGSVLGFLGGYWQGNTGANQTAFFDNVTVTVTPPNTITTGSVSTVPFNLANCAATASGSVAFTSTDVFAVGNVFTAQLSNEVGSFASPVTIGTLSGAGAEGSAPSGSIPITIPAGTVSGSGYRIRIISSNPAVTGTSSSQFQVIQQGACASSLSDTYRSFQTGDWSNVTTWESQSPDNPTWITATLAPTYNANTITILNGHNVTIDAAMSADQLTIDGGGTLTHTNGVTFNLNNGTGTDMILNGTYVLNGTQPTGSGTILIQNGATVRVDANNLPSDADDFAFGNTNVTFLTGSTYEWANTNTPSWSNRTYFTSGQITTFRFTSTPIGILGGGTTNTTVIHGILQADVNITIYNSANKTFVNGITGSGNISADASFTGNILITGTTAVLGGTGVLTLPVSPSVLQIGSASGTTVTLLSSKTIVGNISLLSTNTYVDLASNNLILSGTITGGSTTSYIRTASTGALTINSVTTRDFPVGHTKYNPITIHTGSNHNWTVNVNDGVSPDVPRGTTGAVLLTWNITPSVNPPSAPTDITFQFDSTLAGGQIGIDFNTPPHNSPNNVQIWHRTQGWWLASGTTVPVDPGPSGYVTARALSAQNFSPYGISRISLPLPIKLVDFTATKISGSLAVINWELAACCSKDARFELERSMNSRDFITITTVNGSETNRFYSYNDSRLQKGTNHYRLKMTDVDGVVKYSKVIAIVNDDKGFVITSIAPNPVQDVATVTISAAKKGGVDFKVYDLSGTVVRQWHSNISEGSNTISMNVVGLAAGTYHVLASSLDTRSVFRFIKQ